MGLSYHFWTQDEFQEAIDTGKMLEWEPVFGMDCYGTPRSEVDPYRDAGLGVILVIDVQGAARVRRMCPDCLSVFIRPPSFEELEARLRGRGDDRRSGSSGGWRRPGRRWPGPASSTM